MTLKRLKETLWAVVQDCLPSYCIIQALSLSLSRYFFHTTFRESGWKTTKTFTRYYKLFIRMKHSYVQSLYISI